MYEYLYFKANAILLKSCRNINQVIQIISDPRYYFAMITTSVLLFWALPFSDLFVASGLENP